MEKYPMTKRGADLLQQELENLKKVERPRVIAAIAEARAHGDLKENAEYHAAREQQGFIEGRIAEIEAKLSKANIIDVTSFANNGRVIFGSTVTIMKIDTEETMKYHLVGDDEADLKSNKISYSSPIARGIMGKEEGDVVSIRTPGGETEYEIVSVEYIA